MSFLSQRASHLGSALRSINERSGRRGGVVIAAGALVALGLPLFRHVWNDYRQWHALGRGGVPHNFLGYAYCKLLGPLGDGDVYSVQRYDVESESKSEAGQLLSEIEGVSFFDDDKPILARPGPRPIVSRWIAPVRQLSAAAPEAVTEQLLARIRGLERDFDGALKMAPSQMEGGGNDQQANALHVDPASADPRRRFARRGPYEVYHVHPSEGSAHAIVSAADAKTLVEAGWSERHPLSGAKFGGFPSTYVHVYAPRTEAEVAVHELVARAAARYASRKPNEK